MRILCAMLLVVAGMAHRPMEANATEMAAGYAYMLPDGSVPDICVTSNDDGSKPLKHADHGCEACRIASGSLLAEAQSGAGELIRISTELAFVARPEAGQRLLVPPGARPRGPPSTLADI